MSTNPKARQRANLCSFAVFKIVSATGRDVFQVAISECISRLGDSGRKSKNTRAVLSAGVDMSEGNR
jgi:hypothetical protein